MKREDKDRTLDAVNLAILLLGKGASDEDIEAMAAVFLKIDSTTLAEMSAKAHARRRGKQCRKK